MSRKTMGWLFVAIVLIIVGGIILGGALNMLSWNLSKLSTVKYETNGHEINEKYKDILIETKEAVIELVPWDSAKTLAVCEEKTSMKHSVTLEDGALVVRVVDTRKWYDYISLFNFKTPKITVYLPEGEYGNLSIRSSTGDVSIPDCFSFGSVDAILSTGDVTCYAVADSVKIKTSTGHIYGKGLSSREVDIKTSTGHVNISDSKLGDAHIKVTTGRVDLENVTCESLGSEGSTGNMMLKNVIASGRFSIERSTGDIKLDRCDAAEISIETDTGNITGTLLSDKIFFAETDTGRVSVPRTTRGGRCEITTDTGDINIQFQ